MKLYLGIDGGGTNTRAFLADESGTIIGKSTGGGSNPSHASDAQLAATFQSLVSDVFGSAGASPAECTSAFGGIAGVTSDLTGDRIKAALKSAGLTEAQIAIDHDIRIALAGGLAGKPGIALIVGTGSSCYGRDAQGRTWQSGGWGSLISDEGSGYYLGHASIAAAARIADGRLDASPIKEAVFKWLGIRDISEILHRLYEQGMASHEIAAFAPRVIELGEAGDPVALSILQRGADELAQLVAANHRRLPTAEEPSVAIAGGLGTADTIYRTKILAAIKTRLPGAEIPDAFMSPTAGAVMLAMEQDGCEINSTILNNLRSSQ